MLSAVVDLLKRWLGGSRPEAPVVYDAAVLAAYPSLPAFQRILLRAQAQNDTSLLRRVQDAQDELINANEARRLAAAPPVLEGSPTMVGWKVDEHAQSSVIQLGLDDALKSTVFEPPQPRMTPLPLRSEEMRRMFYDYHDNHPELRNLPQSRRNAEEPIFTIEGLHWKITLSTSNAGMMSTYLNDVTDGDEDLATIRISSTRQRGSLMDTDLAHGFRPASAGTVNMTYRPVSPVASIYAQSTHRPTTPTPAPPPSAFLARSVAPPHSGQAQYGQQNATTSLSRSASRSSRLPRMASKLSLASSVDAADEDEPGPVYSPLGFSTSARDASPVRPRAGTSMSHRPSSGQGSGSGSSKSGRRHSGMGVGSFINSPSSPYSPEEGVVSNSMNRSTSQRPARAPRTRSSLGGPSELYEAGPGPLNDEEVPLWMSTTRPSKIYQQTLSSPGAGPSRSMGHLPLGPSGPSRPSSRQSVYADAAQYCLPPAPTPGRPGRRGSTTSTSATSTTASTARPSSRLAQNQRPPNTKQGNSSSSTSTRASASSTRAQTRRERDSSPSPSSASASSLSSSYHAPITPNSSVIIPDVQVRSMRSSNNLRGRGAKPGVVLGSDYAAQVTPPPPQQLPPQAQGQYPPRPALHRRKRSSTVSEETPTLSLNAAAARKRAMMSARPTREAGPSTPNVGPASRSQSRASTRLLESDQDGDAVESEEVELRPTVMRKGSRASLARSRNAPVTVRAARKASSTSVRGLATSTSSANLARNNSVPSTGTELPLEAPRHHP
ncbi:hypothetical protein DL93DRAFT_2077953 [Clavulina sp. PMI_390]|nr:hypothetical protein DL93DRAFT_2077953 [Clavulina sp. PMI_390]